MKGNRKHIECQLELRFGAPEKPAAMPAKVTLCVQQLQGRVQHEIRSGTERKKGELYCAVECPPEGVETKLKNFVKMKHIRFGLFCFLRPARFHLLVRLY